ncbi:hypothetical protein O3P69_017284 [Scylla paramamosain]|uniref:Uncharacterized protein n=1 Tax=Scylla paramamosain TaxID=85552 RepID=A0AAW0TYF4_SCYPA
MENYCSLVKSVGNNTALPDVAPYHKNCIAREIPVREISPRDVRKPVVYNSEHGGGVQLAIPVQKEYNTTVLQRFFFYTKKIAMSDCGGGCDSSGGGCDSGWSSGGGGCDSGWSSGGGNDYGGWNTSGGRYATGEAAGRDGRRRQKHKQPYQKGGSTHPHSHNNSDCSLHYIASECGLRPLTHSPLLFEEASCGTRLGVEADYLVELLAVQILRTCVSVATLQGHEKIRTMNRYRPEHLLRTCPSQTRSWALRGHSSPMDTCRLRHFPETRADQVSQPERVQTRTFFKNTRKPRHLQGTRASQVTIRAHRHMQARTFLQGHMQTRTSLEDTRMPEHPARIPAGQTPFRSPLEPLMVLKGKINVYEYVHVYCFTVSFCATTEAYRTTPATHRGWIEMSDDCGGCDSGGGGGGDTSGSCYFSGDTGGSCDYDGSCDAGEAEEEYVDSAGVPRAYFTRTPDNVLKAPTE